MFHTSLNNFRTLAYLLITLCFSLKSRNSFALQNKPFSITTTLQSNMVIQQDKPLRVWGKANPRDVISIKADWMPEAKQTMAGSDNNWWVEVRVPQIKAGDFKPHMIQIIDGQDTICFTNVLIGEVWLCSGQSNMEMTMLPALPWHQGVIDYESEIKTANYPHLRLFKVKRDTASLPALNVEAKWEECTPKSVAEFSGVAYYFGRKLLKKLNIPVGLVLSAHGGASAQVFTDWNVLESDPLLKRNYVDNVTAATVMTNRPSLIYNKMIYPLRNLSIKGILWYQGESNAKDSTYAYLTKSMISSWRKIFRQNDLPFYFVQVAPYGWKSNDPLQSDYAVFRELQQCLLKIKHTAMTTTIDLGEIDAIHPRRKKQVGLRLADIALHKSYHFDNIPYCCPVYKKMTVLKDTLIVKFKTESYGSSLTTTDGNPPKCFYIAGADRIFSKASARIINGKIFLTAVGVPQPVAVRYAFFNFVEPNLFSTDSLPVIPFRSDHWATVAYK